MLKFDPYSRETGHKCLNVDSDATLVVKYFDTSSEDRLHFKE